MNGARTTYNRPWPFIDNDVWTLLSDVRYIINKPVSTRTLLERELLRVGIADNVSIKYEVDVGDDGVRIRLWSKD